MYRHYQDWEPVVLQKRTASPGPDGNAAATKKFGGSCKKTAANVDIRHLENEDSDERMTLPTVSMDVRIAIAQARQAKSLSQKELAAKLMIPAKTVQEYEAGRAIPNNALIARMERAMGCKLPRSK